jgi:hyperosmotically inducible periplasmic protein
MKTRFGMIILGTALAGALSVTIAGCNKTPEATGTVAPSTTVGTEIDDSVITTSVKSALLADADVKSFDLKVETRKGNVQLSGFVDDQKQIDHAIAVTHGVAGVKDVENNVALKGAATTVGNKVDDTTITAKVKAALLGDTNIKSSDIAVVTRKNEVQLSGFVDNQGQMDRAIEVARSVEGVSGVANQMSIKK